MGKLLRFLNPKKEKQYIRAAIDAKESIYAAMADPVSGMGCDELTVGLARTAYEVFYEMHRCGLNPSTIAEEIDGFLDLMKENLPKVKENIWQWDFEDKQQ